MCAVPVNNDRGSNSIFASVQVPLPTHICLGDVLKKQGYQTIYMGGAPLEFAGKGKFLNAHGYEAVLGKNALSSRLAPDTETSPWGIYDRDLFELAKKELSSLQENGAPYLFTLLTLDTHHPSGLASPDCRTHERDSGLNGAVRCSQRKLAEFVQFVRVEAPDTLVVVFSDHLALRNDMSSILNTNESKRRLRFVVWGVETGEVDAPGTHFDVMPTLMDMLGIDQFSNHHLGRSLLTYSTGGWFDDGREQEALDGTDIGDLVHFDREVHFEADGPLLSIGGTSVEATLEGMPLDGGVFAIEFRRDGIVSRYLHAVSDDEFLQQLSELPVIGISENPEFNQAHLGLLNTKLAFFYSSEGMNQFESDELWWREKVVLPENWLQRAGKP